MIVSQYVVYHNWYRNQQDSNHPYDTPNYQNHLQGNIDIPNRFNTGSKMINQMIGDNVTKKKEEREYAKNREEYFREFHRVIAPVVVMKKYDE